jgi:hypothetical protein
MLIDLRVPPLKLETTMKKISALVLAATLASTAAYAGGPVVTPVEPAPAVAPAAPASSISAGIVIPLLLLIVVAAAVSNNGSASG